MLPITVVIIISATIILGIVGIFTHLVSKNEMGGIGINDYMCK